MISLTTRTISVLAKHSVVERCTLSQRKLAKLFHTSKQSLCKQAGQKSENKSEEKTQRAIATRLIFDDKEKTKGSFLDVVQQFGTNRLSDRGYTQFIATALKYMKQFGVEKDLEAYKALISILPQDRYIPRNKYQEMFMHYPSQQFVIIDLLDYMEDNAVLPDREIESMLLKIFGEDATVMKKFWRMQYWLPKFYHLNPWKPPLPVPTEPRALSKFAMWKASSVDVLSYIEEFDTKDVPDSIDHTWVVSTMSPAQEELLRVHDVSKPLYVEGPFILWVGDQSVNYFVLKGDPIKREIVEVDTDNVSNIKIPYWEVWEPGVRLTVHEQEDGVYLAMCATGRSTNDSLLSWIKCLEKRNPNLKNIPIVFKLKSTIEEKPMIDYEKPEIDASVTDETSIDAK